MVPDAVLFDLDGTLVDTLLDIAAAMNHVLAEFGCPIHPAKAYRGFVGHGVRELVTRALPATEGQPIDAAAAAFLAYYDAHLVDHTRPFPGIPALLQALAGRGTRLAILSNKPDAQTQRIATTLLHATPFEIVRGQREGVPAKPDPVAALEMAAALGLEPERCTFVGDSPVDIETARNAGMCCIAVTWGYADRDVLAVTWPRTLADTVAKLAEALALRWP